MLSGECCASLASIINHRSSSPHRGGRSVHQEARMRSRSTALVAGAGVFALALSACGGGTGASSSSGGSTGGKVSSIKLVAAEYSKSNTAKFWNDFAQKYQQKTGTKLDVQVISWDDIDQQSSTMIQNGNPPDILNLNVYASYAKDNLLYSADEV